MSNDHKARVGVIGTGWWATRVHIPALAAYERAELVGVADIDLDRARRAAEPFGIPEAFDDHQSLLSLGLDGVVIATPHDTHSALALDCLSGGADVLIEKPMVVDPAEGRRLVETAEELGRRLHVGYVYPHTSHAQRLRRVIADGLLGKLQLVQSLFATSAGVLYRGGPQGPPPSDATFGPDPSTYSSADRGGGQALSQATHSVSLMLFVTGLLPTEVFGYAERWGLDVDLVDAAVLKDASGAVATVASTGNLAIGQRNVECLSVFCTDGHAVLDPGAGTLTIRYPDGKQESPDPLPDEDLYPEEAPSRTLVDAILDDAEVVADGRLGYVTALLLDAMLRSAREGEIRTVEA